MYVGIPDEEVYGDGVMSGEAFIYFSVEELPEKFTLPIEHKYML